MNIILTDLRSWINTEGELASFGVFDRKSFHEQTGKAGAGTTAERVKY